MNKKTNRKMLRTEISVAYKEYEIECLKSKERLISKIYQLSEYYEGDKNQ